MIHVDVGNLVVEYVTNFNTKYMDKSKNKATDAFKDPIIIGNVYASVKSSNGFAHSVYGKILELWGDNRVKLKVKKRYQALYNEEMKGEIKGKNTIVMKGALLIPCNKIIEKECCVCKKTEVKVNRLIFYTVDELICDNCLINK